LNHAIHKNAQSTVNGDDGRTKHAIVQLD